MPATEATQRTTKPPPTKRKRAAVAQGEVAQKRATVAKPATATTSRSAGPKANTGRGKTDAPSARKAATAAATQVNFRADEMTRKDLDFLTADGTPVSEAIRSAIRLAVWRKKEDQMVLDAEAAMADPADVAEIARLAADLDSISAW